MAIPLELKGRSVYMSWNFETNYYFPYFDSTGLVPLPFASVYDISIFNQFIFISNNAILFVHYTDYAT